MADTSILIIGAGPAGLSAAGALKRLGLDSTILDRGQRVGQSWEERYERLHLHTVRDYSGLAHYPIPNSYARYMSRAEYAAYLGEYADYYELNIAHGITARRVRQAPEGGWLVETTADAWAAQVVVVASGQFGRPVLPDLPGLSDYRGETLHSHQYRTGRDFQGQRVLVVGAGNSGMEIATDLAEQGAAGVALSLRTAPPIVPRDFLGVPAQVFGILMHPLPPRVGDALGRFLARLALGDLRRHGFPPAAWQPFSARRTPVIDVGFVSLFKAGRIAIRPLVRACTSEGVTFEDGREEPFDALVFATGFRSGLEDLLELPGLLDSLGNPRFPSGAPTACPGLYFMGFFDSLRGFLYESNLASLRLAREIRAYLA